MLAVRVGEYAFDMLPASVLGRGATATVYRGLNGVRSLSAIQVCSDCMQTGETVAVKVVSKYDLVKRGGRDGPERYER